MDGLYIAILVTDFTITRFYIMVLAAGKRENVETKHLLYNACFTSIPYEQGKHETGKVYQNGRLF